MPHTVKTLVFRFIQIARISKFLPQLYSARPVALLIRRKNEVVVLNVEQFQEFLKLLAIVCDKFFGFFACQISGPYDFCAMLICTGYTKRFVALRAVPASNHIPNNLF